MAGWGVGGVQGCAERESGGFQFRCRLGVVLVKMAKGVIDSRQLRDDDQHALPAIVLDEGLFETVVVLFQNIEGRGKAPITVSSF